METQEITIVDRVASLETTSGLALEFGVQELNKLVERAKAIESADDPQLKEVKKEMVAKRNYIKNYCLDARREIKKVAEGVSEVEGMLLDIFVGEEKRLDEMAEVARKAKEREERLALLPQRKERITAIWGEGHNHGVTEEELLAMDGSTFEGLINRMNSEKLEADRAEIARQQAEIDAKRLEQEKEAQRLEDEKKAREREDLARQEERERLAKEQADKEAKEKAEAEEAKRQKWVQRKNKLQNIGLELSEGTNRYVWRATQVFVDDSITITVDEVENMSDEEWGTFSAKLDADFTRRKEAVEEQERKAKLEADQRYQAWLTEIGYTPEEFMLNNSTEGHIVAYKIVATFKK